MKMKKIISIFILVSLLLTSVTGYMEETKEDRIAQSHAQKIMQTVDAIMFERDDATEFYLNSFFEWEGAMYGVEEYKGRIAKYKDGKWEIVFEVGEDLMEEERRMAIMQDQGMLYALQKDNGKIIQFDTTTQLWTFKEYKQLNWENMIYQEGEYVGIRTISSAHLKGDKLYMSVQNDEWGQDVKCLDINTQEEKVFEVDENADVSNLIPYQDGFLANDYNGILYINVLTGEVKKISSVNNLRSIAVDNQDIYARKEDRIFKIDGDKSTVVAYTKAGIEDWSTPRALIQDGKFVFGVDNAIYSVSVTEPLPTTTLKIAGDIYMMDDALKAFADKNPGVPVIRLQDVWPENSKELADHMKSAESADIYALPLNSFNLNLLKNKDYVLELDSKLVENMYPQYTKSVMVDSKLYALPMGMYAQTYGVSPSAIKKIGLTEEDIPTTYYELCEFIDAWQTTYRENFPEMTLFRDMKYINLKEILTREILQNHEIQQKALGEDIDFASDDMIKTFERIEKTDFFGFWSPDNTEEDGAIDDGYGVTEDGTPNALFTNYSDVTLQQSDMDFRPMPLAVSENVPPCILADITVIVINPASKNIEQAKEMLSLYTQNMDDRSKILWYQNENTPIVNEYAMKFLKNYDAGIAKYNELYQAADEDTQALLNEYKTLENYADTKKHYEDHKYQVSEKSILDYQKNLQYFYTKTASYFDWSNEDVEKLLNRFRDENMDARSFLKELQRKVEMMMMEGE